MDVIPLPDLNSEIQFNFVIEGRFPFAPPKVFACTDFTLPSIADGRDLIPTMIKNSWNPSITLVDLMNSLPGFIRDWVGMVAMNEIWELGVFHLGSPMSLEYVSEKPGMAHFSCMELDSANQRISHERTMIVTHLVILQLDTEDSSTDRGTLISWATL
jgi:hypothetical protein